MAFYKNDCKLHAMEIAVISLESVRVYGLSPHPLYTRPAAATNALVFVCFVLPVRRKARVNKQDPGRVQVI